MDESLEMIPWTLLQVTGGSREHFSSATRPRSTLTSRILSSPGSEPSENKKIEIMILYI